MKKVLLTIAGLVVALGLFYFIPVTQKKTLTIGTNIYNITTELLQPQNWTKWQRTINDVYTKDSSLVQIDKATGNNDFTIVLPEHQFHVKQMSPILYLVREVTNHTTYNYAINIIPKEENEVQVLVVNRMNLLRSFFPFKENPADITANSLKHFLENPNAFYGYNIEIKKVVDTVVATKKMTILKKDLFQVLPQAFKTLEQYVQQNRLQPVNNREVSYNDLYNDSMDVMFGIPVNTFAPPVNEIKCLNIPKGRMVVGYYEGKFKDRRNIYNAFERYISDYKLQKVAAPFEKYVNNVLPASDTAMVKFELYYPIY